MFFTAGWSCATVRAGGGGQASDVRRADARLQHGAAAGGRHRRLFAAKHCGGEREADHLRHQTKGWKLSAQKIFFYIL